MINFAMLVFVIGLSLSSLYVFDSGIPQPADVILSFSAFLILCHSALQGRLILNSVPASWLALVAWVFVVCLIWSLALASYDFFINFSFWLYNLLIASSISFLLYNYRAPL